MCVPASLPNDRAHWLVRKPSSRSERAPGPSSIANAVMPSASAVPLLLQWSTGRPLADWPICRLVQAQSQGGCERARQLYQLICNLLPLMTAAIAAARLVCCHCVALSLAQYILTLQSLTLALFHSLQPATTTVCVCLWID